ncbi:MAG: hypothetical protein HUJ97_06005 [Bacteroidales bacterium]|nr:hypothetical protein [Bacteroidales bacterium]
MKRFFSIALVFLAILSSCTTKRANDKVLEDAMALEDSVKTRVLDLAKSAEISYNEMKVIVQNADYEVLPDSIFLSQKYAQLAQTNSQKVKLIGMYLCDIYIKSSVYNIEDSVSSNLVSSLHTDVNMPYKKPVYLSYMTSAERHRTLEKSVHETIVKNIEFGTIAQRVKLLTFLGLEFEYIADRILGITNGNYEGTELVENLKIARTSLIELFDIFAPRTKELDDIAPIINKLRAIEDAIKVSDAALDLACNDLHQTCLQKRASLLKELK